MSGRIKTYFVYAIYDIRDFKQRYYYVGSTLNLKKRTSEHRVNKGHHQNENLVDWVAENGEYMAVQVMETVTGSREDAKRAEQRWMDKLGNAGHPLLNILPAHKASMSVNSWWPPATRVYKALNA